ncbi:TPA: hypothetical protein HA318_05810 [Candidatus Micrarchaeota archaeon]|nr:MAG: hypothetical protein AUJ65_02905 [Candidatus Micrarchaeota archaeon CG1_02_51_15]HII39484.1 hypothetical protein [Candidatus Micrarchaeota archaeon]
MKKNDEPKPIEKPLPYLAAAVITTAAFFLIAFSELPVYAKAVACIACLAICGKALQIAGGFIGGWGVIVLRGRNGFNAMKILAQKFASQSTALSELGLTLFFGALYGWKLFGKNPKKLAAHLLVLVFFAWAFQMTATGRADLTPVFTIISVLFGLAATFFIIIAMNAFSIGTNFETAAPGAMPAIPGLTLPIEAIASLVILMIVHEMAHGILFFIEKLKVKSSGVILFGFIPIGAFVEQDEKQFEKTPIEKRRRVLVAGSTANFLTAFLFVILSVPLAIALGATSGGVFVNTVSNASNAYGVLPENSTIIALNGVPIASSTDLGNAMQPLEAGEVARIQTKEGGDYSVTLKEKGKLGIIVSNTPKQGMELPYAALALLFSVANLTALLNLMVALFNMMPLFITDGHYIIRDELIHALGPKREKQALLSSKAIAIIFLLILAVNFLPWLKG